MAAGTLIVAALLGPLAAIGAARARPVEPAGRVPTSCRDTLRFGGEPYGLLARGVPCSFAHRWAARYQRQGRHPRHWSCVGREAFTEEGLCQDRRSDAYFQFYAED